MSTATRVGASAALAGAGAAKSQAIVAIHVATSISDKYLLRILVLGKRFIVPFLFIFNLSLIFCSLNLFFYIPTTASLRNYFTNKLNRKVQFNSITVFSCRVNDKR
jgi:hypothetical protein